MDNRNEMIVELLALRWSREAIAAAMAPDWSSGPGRRAVYESSRRQGSPEPNYRAYDLLDALRAPLDMARREAGDARRLSARLEVEVSNLIWTRALPEHERP